MVDGLHFTPIVPLKASSRSFLRFKVRLALWSTPFLLSQLDLDFGSSSALCRLDLRENWAGAGHGGRKLSKWGWGLAKRPIAKGFGRTEASDHRRRWQGPPHSLRRRADKSSHSRLQPSPSSSSTAPLSLPVGAGDVERGTVQGGERGMVEGGDGGNAEAETLESPPKSRKTTLIERVLCYSGQIHEATRGMGPVPRWTQWTCCTWNSYQVFILGLKMGTWF